MKIVPGVQIILKEKKNKPNTLRSGCVSCAFKWNKPSVLCMLPLAPCRKAQLHSAVSSPSWPAPRWPSRQLCLICSSPGGSNLTSPRAPLLPASVIHLLVLVSEVHPGLTAPPAPGRSTPWARTQTCLASAVHFFTREEGSNTMRQPC